MMVGYHSQAGSGGNPLAHTMSSGKIERMFINGREASEFLLHGYVGAKHGVPMAFVAGDKELCREVTEVSPDTATFVTMEGVGDSTISIHPGKSLRTIRKTVCDALKSVHKNRAWPLPDEFELSIRYVKQTAAYRASQYNGAETVSPKTVRYRAKDYDDIMRFILFCV
jgi:D-amino peptidase